MYEPRTSTVANIPACRTLLKNSWGLESSTRRAYSAFSCNRDYTVATLGFSK